MLAVAIVLVATTFSIGQRVLDVAVFLICVVSANWRLVLVFVLAVVMVAVVELMLVVAVTTLQ